MDGKESCESLSSLPPVSLLPHEKDKVRMAYASVFTELMVMAYYEATFLGSEIEVPFGVWELLWNG